MCTHSMFLAHRQYQGGFSLAVNTYGVFAHHNLLLYLCLSSHTMPHAAPRCVRCVCWLCGVLLQLSLCTTADGVQANTHHSSDCHGHSSCAGRHHQHTGHHPQRDCAPGGACFFLMACLLLLVWGVVMMMLCSTRGVTTALNTAYTFVQLNHHCWLALFVQGCRLC